LYDEELFGEGVGERDLDVDDIECHIITVEAGSVSMRLNVQGDQDLGEIPLDGKFE
jgi:hypothetical protein